MKLMEYHGKELFRKYGIDIPVGCIVENKNDIKKLRYPCVFKVQIPVGGRGKSGGIVKVEDIDSAEKKVSELLDMRIRGYTVKKILAEEYIEINKEIYLSVSIDRTERMPLIMISEKGGVDIESVADEDIFKIWVNPLIGLQRYHIRMLLSNLSFDSDNIKKNIANVITKIYSLFRDYDCELVEINPLVLTSKNKLIALDSKIIINDDAIYRHEDIPVVHEEFTSLEKEAKENDIAFVQLDGNIGVIANGAGLTMATLDALTYYNGKAGVFLDLGGTDDVEKVKKAFQLMKKAKPKVILLNLFGGITRCDTVAKGVKEIISTEGIDCPIIARIKGTHENIAKEILRDAGLIATDSLQDAARYSCELAGD